MQSRPINPVEAKIAFNFIYIDNSRLHLIDSPYSNDL